MSNEERDRLVAQMVEGQEEAMADLRLLQDAQLRLSTQIEELNKVVFGLVNQIDELTARLEREGVFKKEVKKIILPPGSKKVG